MADLPLGKIKLDNVGGRVTLAGEVTHLDELIGRARSAAAQEEREAVVGWLNSWASHLAAHPHKTDIDLIWWIAERIEAGEHRAV